jgi:hypothetical protein
MSDQRNDSFRPAVLRYRNGQAEQCDASDAVGGETTEIVVRREGTTELVPLSLLKAVFFLRSRPLDTEDEEPQAGSSLAVEFADGETIRGMAPGYNPAATGFFLVPDDRSKIELIFVISSAIVSIDVEKL